jgi:hypothetical protein
MSSSNIQKFETNVTPIDILQNRRQERKRDQRNRRLGRQILAGAGVAVALLGGSLVFGDKPNPRKAQLKAALISREIPTTNPNVMIEPYRVGNQTKDVMLSEVAADLHPLSTDNQDAMEAIDALDTYLKPTQIEQDAFYPGQKLNIAIDKKSGDILPKTIISK